MPRVIQQESPDTNTNANASMEPYSLGWISQNFATTDNKKTGDLRSES